MRHWPSLRRRFVRVRFHSVPHRLLLGDDLLFPSIGDLMRGERRGVHQLRHHRGHMQRRAVQMRKQCALLRRPALRGRRVRVRSDVVPHGLLRCRVVQCEVALDVRHQRWNMHRL